MTAEVTQSRENEPKDGALYQQRMKAWYPILHPVWVFVTLLVVGVVFIPVGTCLESSCNRLSQDNSMPSLTNLSAVL